MSYATKEQLQELIEHIGDNLYLPQMVQYFDKSNVYSTDEKMIGQWIDGKPLYQKTFNCGNLLNAGQLNFTHNISNINNIWVESGFAITVDGSTIITIPQINPGYLERGVHCSADKTNIYIITGTDRSDFIGYVTVRYTKTTDPALDYTIGTENDYSTEERLIGTWVDGKPIYQKSFELVFPVVATDGTYVANNLLIDDLNIENVVSQDGYWSENNASWLPLNFVSDNGQFHTSVYVWYNSSSNHYALKYGTDRVRYGNQPLVVTIQYTKTS